jgi:hypothetical protein
LTVKDVQQPYWSLVSAARVCSRPSGS